MIIQEKINNNGIQKKKVTKKRKIDKKAIREKQRTIAEKAMENAHKKNYIEDDSFDDSFEEEREKTVVITKEERAKRFKRLHIMVQDIMKKTL